MAILINNPRIRNYYKKIRPVLDNPRASAYFMLILSFFTLSFFGIFAIKPALVTITQLQRELADSREVSQKLQEKRNNLLRLQVEYKDIETDLPVIFSAIPQQVEAPMLFLKVRTLATLDNIQITGLQFAKSPLSQASGSSQLTTSSPTFSFTATGTYQNINKFLLDLASLDRVITFNKIGLTRAIGEGSDLTLQVTGKVYTLF